MIFHSNHYIWRISFVLLVFGMCISAFALWQVSQSKDFTVHFFDVGQGDAILLSRGSSQVLIDAGANGVVLLEQLGSAMPFWDRTVEVIIATHPDSDHIGGFSDVLKNYDVEHFFTTTQQKDSETFTVMQELIKTNDVETHLAQAGDQIFFGEDIFLDVVYPFTADTSMIADANDASITVVVHASGEKFFLAGDLPKEVEDLLPLDDTITVLKASHHGSKTSTSAYFLDKIKPRDVIISAGKDNRYNHPSDDVMQRFYTRNINIFRTDEHGGITYTCIKTCEVIFE